jgi:hypothetical protein
MSQTTKVENSALRYALVAAYGCAGLLTSNFFASREEIVSKSMTTKAEETRPRMPELPQRSRRSGFVRRGGLRRTGRRAGKFPWLPGRPPHLRPSASSADIFISMRPQGTC